MQQTARGDRYDLGCLYVGVNDVRGLDWDRAAFERDRTAALAFLAERCERVLTVTLPLDLGRPRAGANVDEVERRDRGVGARHGRARRSTCATSARATS